MAPRARDHSKIVGDGIGQAIYAALAELFSGRPDVVGGDVFTAAFGFSAISATSGHVQTLPVILARQDGRARTAAQVEWLEISARGPGFIARPFFVEGASAARVDRMPPESPIAARETEFATNLRLVRPPWPAASRRRRVRS